jgi:homotetrameric cytidine deaminase
LADFDRLVEEARRARANAVAPYSRFEVGAALSTPDGRIYGGGNVESAAYGLTMCAERVALFRALADGARAFDGLAVVADTAEPTPPCGACRQLLWEYAGDLPIVVDEP